MNIYYAGYVEFETATGLHSGFSSYNSIEELEILIRSLIHDGYVIEDI